MARLLFTIAAWLLTMALQAQTAREDFARSLSLSGSNFVAYPGPQQQLSPAPKGKHPCYISHYGRHGSRYQTKSLDYNYAYNVLNRAEAEGKLSPLGSDVLQRLTIIRQESTGRIGDLTPLGVQQQADIARRMYERFPEVFKGKATVDARSTTTPRCILSMSSFVQQLMRLNSRLTLHQDASEHDHYYLKHAYKPVTQREAKDAYSEYCQRHACHERMVGQLFNDTAYVKRYINGERLCFYLFRIASNLQSSELSKQLSLYDLFTFDEIYQLWQKENASWFLGFGFSSLNGGDMPYSQSALLRRIIEQADSCLQLRTPGCHLRFGHETMLLPLVCLMGLNGYGQTIDDIDLLEQKGWLCYRVFPMGCNLQIVFYRSSAKDDDVLLKVLLNEDEATLPIATDVAPYYHWKDFRRYYLQLLDDYANRKR